MTWLTWRQFRGQAAVVFAAVAVLAVLLAITGPRLAGLSVTAGTSFLSDFTADGLDQGLYFGGLALVYAVPGVIGAFWAAPLIARELETGTHRLVWNQTVSRARWLAVKLGLIGLFVLAAAGLASLVVGWWAAPVDHAFDAVATAGPGSMPRLTPLVFAARGVAPMGYAAFAFTFGVTAGLVLRRTVVAMAVTLAVFVAVQIVMPLAVRSHELPPVRQTTVITAQNLQGMMADSPSSPMRDLVVRLDAPGAWILSSHTVDATGAAVDVLPSWVGDCMGPPPAQPGLPQPPAASTQSQKSCFARLAQAGYQQLITYQPADRFWPLQWFETGVFLVLSLLLGGFSFWWLKRRTS